MGWRSDKATNGVIGYERKNVSDRPKLYRSHMLVWGLYWFLSEME
jgi:hypothetical protein